MQVEKIRRKYFRRNDLRSLDPLKARQIKRDLRVGRTRLRKLPEGTPLRTEALELFNVHIELMDALARQDERSEQLFEASRECFELYVARMKGVV